MRIIVADSDEVEEYEQIARSFMSDILGIDYDRCAITDQSELSDFLGSGNAIILCDNESLIDFTARWDAWVIKRVLETYGIEVFATEGLPSIFAKIYHNRSTVRH